DVQSPHQGKEPGAPDREWTAGRFQPEKRQAQVGTGPKEPAVQCNQVHRKWPHNPQGGEDLWTWGFRPVPCQRYRDRDSPRKTETDIRGLPTGGRVYQAAIRGNRPGTFDQQGNRKIATW